MNYRADIDGLRALAVVPVVLFHAGLPWFEGGYIGVDIFFVISGFLITSLIIDDLERNRFSFWDFYERRARRILPALFFVVLCSTPFAWLLMVPDQFQAFSRSLIAVSLFGSNILFWKESGYFDAAAEEKPLLHTWSLAVEEQYYLVFPLFLLSVWRFGIKPVVSLIVAVAVVSFGLSEWGWRHWPTGNFYLTPSRIWELLAGSLCAFCLRDNGLKSSSSLSLLGLAAVFFSMFSYDKNTPFPSSFTLLPVIGAMLVILYGGGNTLVSRMLSTKIMVGIGLISYSLYLWHQPVFAFARIILIEEASGAIMVALSVMSVCLAVVSWKFVEQPFRKRDKYLVCRKRLVFAVLGVLSFFCFIGVAGHSEYLNSRLSNISKMASDRFGDFSYAGDGYDWFDTQEGGTYLLIGDSHAKQYLGALRERLGKVSLVSKSACMSLPNLVNQYKGQTSQRVDCIQLQREYLSYVNNSNIETIFIAHRWNKQLFDIDKGVLVGRPEESEAAMKLLDSALSDFLLEIGEDINVVIIGSVPAAYVAGPKFDEGFIDCIVRQGESNCPGDYPRNVREGKNINAFLSNFASRFEHVRFLDPASSLCDERRCYLLKGQNVIYSDHAHLTRFGAKQVIGGL